MPRMASLLATVCVLLWLALSMQPSNAQATAEDLALASVRDTADEVVRALQAKDGERLASFVHPKKGVRFSPSAFVDPGEDGVVLSAEQVQGFWNDSRIYRWGYAEGSGDPIEMTPADYAARYVLDRDYLDASSVSINDDRASGTTANNAAEAYPGGAIVEYYIEPSTSGMNAGTDWAALRLVFEPLAGSWRLVAIIHDEWSV